MIRLHVFAAMAAADGERNGFRRADAPPGASILQRLPSGGTAGVATPVPRVLQRARTPCQSTTAMTEVPTRKRPATVMDRIAKGFTDDETKAIAAFFAAQKE